MERTPGASKPTFLRAIFVGIATLLAFTSNFQPGREPSNISLDSSWASVLAHDAIAGKQWGQDTIFTYGPLSFLSPYLGYSPDTFIIQLFGQGLFALLYAVTVFYTARKLSSTGSFLLAFILFLFFSQIAGDVAWLTSYCLSAYAINTVLSREHKRYDMLFIATLMLAPSALIVAKASAAPCFMIWSLCLFGLCLLHKKYNHAAVVVLVAVLAPLSIWLSFGQKFSVLGDYVKTTFDIIVGYQTAMSFAPSSRATDALGLQVLLLALGLQIVQARRPADKIVSLLFAATLLVSFKASFLRADWAHLHVFTIAAIIICVLCTERPGAIQREATHTGKLTRAVPAIVILVAYLQAPDAHVRTSFEAPVLGTIKALNLLSAPTKTIDEMRIVYDKNRQNEELSTITAVVGKDPVDVFSYEQGSAYFNHLNLDHRPVLQSYSSYTPRLNEINKAFFNAQRAPKWLIFKLQSIDRRLPFEDDALALPYVLTNYQPVLMEKGYLLLQRADASRDCSVTFDAPQNARLGQWITVPGTHVDTVWLRAQVRYSFIGRLRSLILRPPSVDIEVVLSSGRSGKFRLLPAVAREGFVISPALSSTPELASWLQGDRSASARAIRILPGHAASSEDFQADLEIAFAPDNCHMTRP